MKRGFLNKPKAKGGLLHQPSSLGSASPPLSDMETLAQTFQDILRVQGLGDSGSTGGTDAPSVSVAQKIQDVLRGFDASQAESKHAPLSNSNEQKMQNVLFESGGKKLEYGKVETAAIPKDYKPADIHIVHMDGKKTDHEADALLFTTIPYKTFNDPRDPDGHSEWMVHGPTKAKVLNAPGYPKSVPKPKVSYDAQPAYVIRPTLDMGLGVFATRDIRMGELIFAERPLLVSPRSNLAVAMRLDPTTQHYDVKTQMAIGMMEWEKMLEVAVGRMESEDRKAFMELENSHKYDGSGPILGIIRTNGFRVGSIFDGPEMRADGCNAYSGVIKIGSRINHSCMPNVGIEFSIPSFSFQCSAMIDIRAGEQLYYAYCGTDQSVAERQAELAPYGIVCSCSACTHATQETDKLRKEYRKIAMEYILKGNWLSSGKRVADRVIDPVMQFKDALIREGLHYTSEYKAMILMIQNFYEGIGMEEKARPYREEYKRYKLF